MTYEELWEKISVDFVKSSCGGGGFKYIRDDGFETESNIKKWVDENITIDEKKVLDMQKGCILDLACGFGRHIKYLKEKKSVEKIVGVECVRKIVEFNKTQGMDVLCDNMSCYVKVTEEKYDSVLLMGNAIAECGSLEGIREILEHIYQVLNTNGNIVISYKDFSKTSNEVHLDYQKKNAKEGKYCGLVTVKLEYRNWFSKEKQLCYMEQNTMNEILKQVGFVRVYENMVNHWCYTVWKKKEKNKW